MGQIEPCYRRLIFYVFAGCVLLLVLGVGSGAADAMQVPPSDGVQHATGEFSDDRTHAYGGNGTQFLHADTADLSVQSAAFDRSEGAYTVQSADTDVELDQQLRRVTDQKGTYEVRHRYTLPSALRSLEVTVPAESNVVKVEGFVQTEDPRTHRWDGQTPEPEIVYRSPANRSIDQTGPIAGPGRLIFADVGEWGVISQPATAHRWGWSGPTRVGFDRTVSAREGAVGEAIAYLGEYDEYTHVAHEQTFRLIVPARATLAEEPETLFESLASASDTLRVGDRDEEVFMIATPTRSIDWGVRGLQTGPADLWTRDLERLDDPDNVWLHEYVHTRQGYSSAPDLEWFTEGSATYYAALLTLEQDRINFEQFHRRLAIGSNERQFRGSILNDPATWRSNANYHVGALVAGELDRQLRLSSERDQSLQEVFRRLNAQNDVVTAATFRTFIRDAGGESVATTSDQYTSTTDRPQMWELLAHDEAFGDPPAPARITFSLSERDDAIAVSGPYRNRSLVASSDPVLVPDERLAFDVIATNYGETTGTFEAQFRLNDEEVATRTDTLDPGKSQTLSFSHTFDSTGEYVLSVGDVDIRVSVREPAVPEVDSIAANQTTLSSGDSVQISATVRNDAERPGKTRVPLTQNGEQFDAVSVSLDSGETETITVDRKLEEAGTYVFGLGNHSAETVIVTVEERRADSPADNSKADADDADIPTDNSEEDAEEDTRDTADDDVADHTVDDDGADDDATGDGFDVLVPVLAIGVILLGIRRNCIGSCRRG